MRKYNSWEVNMGKYDLMMCRNHIVRVLDSPNQRLIAACEIINDHSSYYFMKNELKNYDGAVMFVIFHCNMSLHIRSFVLPLFRLFRSSNKIR